MPKFRTVELYPSAGHPNQLWGQGSGNVNAIRDAILRSGRVVSELYSEALSSLDVDGLKSMFRIFANHQPTYVQDYVRVRVLLEKPYDSPGEFGFLQFPRSTGWLAAEQRASLVLKALHAAVLELARIRDFDPQQFEICRNHVESSGFRFESVSPWRASPNRRLQARATFSMDAADGYGRISLEVRPFTRKSASPEAERQQQAAGAEKILSTEPAIGPTSHAAFVGRAKTLKWVSSQEVQLQPIVDLRAAVGARRPLLAARVEPSGSLQTLIIETVRVRQPTPEEVVGVRPSKLSDIQVVVEQDFDPLLG